MRKGNSESSISLSLIALNVGYNAWQQGYSWEYMIPYQAELIAARIYDYDCISTLEKRSVT